MSLQSWHETITNQIATGTSFGTYTTAKTVINPQALVVLPAGYMTIGKMLLVTVAGGIGNLVTTPGTITFQVMFGANIVFTSGAIQLNATAHTNLPFWLEIMLTCRAVGNSTNANLMGQARVSGVMFTSTAGQTDGANTMTTLMAPTTAPGVGAGFDSTVTNIVDFFTGFSISDAANTIKVEQYRIDALN